MKLISWNILQAARGWKSWRERMQSLASVLEQERPDLVCLQEAVGSQLQVLSGRLPGHRLVAVGREDGIERGEACAIYYRRDRFRLLDQGTFWLSKTPEVPSRTWRDRHSRICTWVRLEDMFRLREDGAGTPFLLMNTHLPVPHKRRSRHKAARLIARRLVELREGMPALLTGDFNSGPGGRTWNTFSEAGLRDTEVLFGARGPTRTWHVRGVPVMRLDGILATDGWDVLSYRVLKARPDGVYPSDHFGLAAQLKQD